MRLQEKFVSKKTATYIKQLYIGDEASKRIRILGREKSLRFTLIAATAVLVAIPVFIADAMSHSTPVTSVRRSGYGEGDRTVSLTVCTEDGITEKVRVDVPERRYTEEELESMSQELDECLWDEILGDNQDRDHVMYDLVFPEHIEGYPFSITWKTDRPLIITSSGAIGVDRLEEEDKDDEGVDVQIRATLKYMDHTEDKYSYVTVRRMNAPEGIREKIEAAVEENANMQVSDEDMMLPSNADGIRIVFYDRTVNRGWAVLFIGITLAFLMMSAKDREVKEEADRRRQQMDEDLPKILNQYMLYHIAGMNPRTIWSAICKRYEEREGAKGRNRRYAYEEMITARNRMREGCGELAAYDEFAVRCDSVRYRSFVSIVKQSVVKGNRGLEDLMYEETEKARREGNDRIRIQASEAETKLLLPMFMMLIDVLVVVMVPAFIGLN